MPNLILLEKWYSSYPYSTGGNAKAEVERQRTERHACQQEKRKRTGDMKARKNGIYC